MSETLEKIRKAGVVGCGGAGFPTHIKLAGDIEHLIKSSLEAGQQIGDYCVVDAILIPRVHPQVIEAMSRCSMPKEQNALGIMEYFSITAAIYGADAAVKAADVEIIDVRLGTGIGGKSFVILTGEIAAVNEAVKCGIERANDVGLTIESVVIPNPREEIYASLL